MIVRMFYQMQNNVVSARAAALSLSFIPDFSVFTAAGVFHCAVKRRFANSPTTDCGGDTRKWAAAKREQDRTTRRASAPAAGLLLWVRSRRSAARAGQSDLQQETFVHVSVQTVSRVLGWHNAPTSFSETCAHRPASCVWLALSREQESRQIHQWAPFSLRVTHEEENFTLPAASISMTGRLTGRTSGTVYISASDAAK